MIMEFANTAALALNPATWYGRPVVVVAAAARVMDQGMQVCNRKLLCWWG